DDTAVCDALIRAIERRNVNVIPVFSYLGMKVGMKELGIESIDIAQKYFMDGGKPIIDLLVSRQGFYLVSRTIGEWVDPTTEGMDILERLNVPVIKAVTPYYKTIEEWRQSSEGIDALTTAMDVMMPEVDGVIEPIVVGASEKIEEATVGGTFDKREPIEEQVEFLVDRCMKWIRLKDLPNEEKKVAFVLHNNPCASAEATVGMGFGLDTIESMVRILHKMKEEGYDVGNIPETSKELIDTILSRKAISEFRWTPISEVVRKGGAAALLPREKYLSWFSELPDKIKQEIIETWGDPDTDFSKEQSEDANWAKLSMGLYEDKIVIPGLKFGNIFLCIQPKRGCAGARCDGRVCKILHDPTCPPPHQWLAVYRWIEREFKADVIVHVGTHGYLEFLPGKRCGLSTECYPQISIGSIPHLYIYNINNPMEGITAKRRGYATIIDHLTPVMSPTETYAELEELEDLLSQYNKAKAMDDKNRLKVIFGMIIEKAKEANLYKEFLDPNEIMDYLHEQLTLIRETQIREGLHVLGKAPEGDKLVNLLVGIMRFDAGKNPSIRRAIHEAMDLDYEEIVDNPKRFNETFGKTNGELLNDSTHMAINIMRKVLEEVLS
ncbi:cobaltochelatase subunit CobN, partial [Methanophagales archaeon]